VFDETGDERIEVIEKGIATALSWVRTELGLGNVAVARPDRRSFAGARFTQPIRRVLVAFILIILLGSTWGAAASAQEAKLVVFAAASLKDALDAVNAAYRREKSQEIITSYAASSTLAKQIEAPVPADIFISAGLDWMDIWQRRI